jgi:hypothetical protein
MSVQQQQQQQRRRRRRQQTIDPLFPSFSSPEMNQIPVLVSNVYLKNQRGVNRRTTAVQSAAPDDEAMQRRRRQQQQQQQPLVLREFKEIRTIPSDFFAPFPHCSREDTGPCDGIGARR